MTYKKTLYIITSIGFLILAAFTSSTALTGFAVAETPTKSGLLGLLLLFLAIFSAVLGKYSN